MNTKILIATPLYPPDIGGPATYTKLLEEQLPAEGFTVSVVSFGDSRHLPKGISHLHYGWKVFRASKRCALIFAQDPVSVGLPAMLVAKLRRLKFMIRMPGDYAWEQSFQRYGVGDNIDDFQTKKYGWRVEWLRWVQGFVSKRADAIVTPSDYFNRLVVGWGIKADRVKTIYNGVDLDIKPAEVVGTDAKTLVTAGRLVPWKGIDELLAVMLKLPDWQLIVLGDGPERQRLEELVREKDLTNQIKFLGSVSRAEVFGYYKVAKGFVLNTYFESFSYQIVEAMAAGVPVITTRVGSIPELISPNQEGVLVEPGDITALTEAISSLESEPDQWQKRVTAAKAKAQQFSLEKNVNQTATLLKTVINEQA